MRFSLRILALASMPIFLSACDFFSDPDDHDGQFYFSNSAVSPLEFKIDEQSFSVKYNEIGMVELKPGKHVLETSDGKKQPFLVYSKNQGGIINPNRELYYTYNMVYAIENHESKFSPQNTEVVIDGVTLEGPIRSSDAVFIDNNVFRCTYPIGTPFPEEIVIYDKKSKGNIKSKCFRKKEFIDFYEQESGEALHSEHDSLNSNDNSVTDEFDYRIPTVDLSNPELQKRAQNYIALLNEYVNADNAKKQEKIREQYTKLAMDNTNISYEKIDSEERVKYDNFFRKVSHIIMAGILSK
ncbi:hypothetical protein [Xenorhabdus bovienii]|uniref:hypothetical protein n=1 Tax=Xenorhabdus bovienii TaxID=40576 RepID=UPI00237D1A23|nr:hypothetical protein [Xenorhabdus bovienii]MDE1482797.1 hypothetical protein [Xenorhabdus bovienii]MDE9428433.1 hypothetical protein [Xenorhabdus bovienii]MDE9431297.1 hypothetical protein [Xenorhabdus bovienii]MDE9442097.1 hypothetical protein [Xenorhabdus bovienii]MDE9489265.1 hypothetical protein [Xenorhabdus bovienii]